MTKVRPAGWLGFAVMLGWLCAGCSNKMLDPTQVGRFRPTPAVNVILDSLGVAEESPMAWENADTPRPKDIVAVRGDYTLRAGDLVRIAIFELYQEGATMVNDYLVNETGKISIPEVGVLQAAGLTEAQLEEEIRQILSPAILRDPSVTVTLMNSQQRTYSILGNGVSQPGRYALPRYDFRLTDALAMAGGPMQFNVSHIYVSRGQETATPGLDTTTTPMPQGELELIRPGSSSSVGSDEPLRVMRPANAGRTRSPQEIPEPSEPAEKFELEREMLDLIAPSAKAEWPKSDKIVRQPQPAPSSDRVAASAVPPSFRLLVPKQQAQERKPRWDEIVVSPSEFGGSASTDRSSQPAKPTGRVEWVFRNGKWVPISIENGQAVDTQRAAEAEAKPTPRETARPQPPADQIEWVQRDGQWMPVVKEAAKPTAPPPAEQGPLLTKKGSLPMEAEWDEAVQTRLIKVPADKLLAGDPRYNIVIKPGDTIYVPVDIIGEFCITGNVNRSGYVPLTGRPMTLKMAIAAAGGLGPLAYPKYCEVIRRLGDNREEIVMVDLDKIASGEQPDFFIKPNDLINVGTHPTSRWRAVLRNAFRAAYGFGFVYDRNFAYSEDSYGTSFF